MMGNKQTVQYIITAVLVVALIVLVMARTKKKGTANKKEGIVAAAKGVVSSITNRITESQEDISDVIDLQKKRAELSWGRDPFFFMETKKVYKGKSISLRGVSLGRDKAGFAYINDEIVTVGDNVEGYLVLEIQKDKVLLRRGLDSFYLSLAEE